MKSGRTCAPFIDAALVVVALLDAVVMTDPDRPYADIVAVAAALALAVRRRWPYLVFALTLPATAVSPASAAGAVALYTVSATTRSRRTIAVCAVLYSLACLAQLPDDDFPAAAHAELLLSFGYNIATAAAAIFLGQLVQARRDLRQRLTEIDQAREHEQQLLAQTVLAKERAQLAREMHDVVSHQVSLIAVQAGALQVNTTDPDTKTTAKTIRELSVRTLDELRHMVTVLRASGTAPTELTPQPTLAGLAQLIANSGIETRLVGDLPADISAATQRAIYRTVQEALTNIRKHAQAPQPPSKSSTTTPPSKSSSPTPRQPTPPSPCPAPATASSDCVNAPNSSAAPSPPAPQPTTATRSTSASPPQPIRSTHFRVKR